MISYDTIVPNYDGDIPAWDGTGVSQDGCSTPTSYNLASYDGGSLPANEVKTYEPYREYSSRSPVSSNGQAWNSTRRNCRVRMTPYSRSITKETNTLVGVRRLSPSVYGRLAQKLGTHKVGGSCTTYCVAKEAQYSYQDYTEQGDLGHWSSKLPILTFSGVDEAEILSQVQATRLEAVSKSFRDYDALTELFEFPETAKMFSSGGKTCLGYFRSFMSRHALSDLIRASRLTPRSLIRHASRALRSIGKNWMTYRYGIMPLVYSFKDIQKVVTRGQYIRDRGFRSVNTYSLSPDIPDSNQYIRKDVSGSIGVTTTVVAAYRTTSLARMSRISVNPLVTAWELIPYSFVFDWFVNVGDYITANFSANFADHVGACTAIRRQITETYRLIFEVNDTIERNLVKSSSPYTCWAAGTYPWSLSYNSLDQGVLRVNEVNSYARSPFSRGGSTSLSFRPNLHWRRYLDSAALTINQIRSIRGLLR